jgi:hypothetical protein
MRALLRALLLLIILVVVVAFAWRGWNAPRVDAGQPPSIDWSNARERSLEAKDKAVELATDVKENVAEAQLTAKIKAKMALDDTVQARTIDVTTTGTVVTLSGTVRSTAERERAVALARDTAGITRVVDRLVVRG